MAETQAIRRGVSSGPRSEDELDEATGKIAGLVEESIPKSEEGQIKQSLKAQLGAELWGHLEPRTRKFLVTAEYLYRTGVGKDIDFGPTAVAFTKPLETELRLKFCLHLARYAQAQHLDKQKLKAGETKLKWEDLAEHGVALGPIENLLRYMNLPENSAVVGYLGTLPLRTANYVKNELPDVIKELRENGRNGGAHIDPVDQEVVDRLRSIVLDKDAHLRYWVEM
jgi:hypothetical protein